ncbi:hypothetical protein RRG08_036707 [Elysia crispata]|uniref:Uncharacterized protein n=1 Tax=Elysia crispata TaxID=231223 RepID=A0AAE1CM78_9GAST|nr:hypothetical protein RRG08_036707 [Elysia crispata]
MLGAAAVAGVLDSDQSGGHTQRLIRVEPAANKCERRQSKKELGLCGNSKLSLTFLLTLLSLSFTAKAEESYLQNGGAKGISQCTDFTHAMFQPDTPENPREDKPTSGGQQRFRSRSFPVDASWEEMYGDFYYYYPHKFVNNVLQSKIGLSPL